MTAPTQFPVWMQCPGQPDTLIQDLPSYNAAIANGYTYNATATPEAAVEVLGNDQGSVLTAETDATNDGVQADPLQPTDLEE